MSEFVQSYNSGNKQWVKRSVETGQVVDNDSDKFPGVPVAEKKTVESQSESGENDQADNTESSDSESVTFFEF